MSTPAMNHLWHWSMTAPSHGKDFEISPKLPQTPKSKNDIDASSNFIP
jgi:hypothetical protein